MFRHKHNHFGLEYALQFNSIHFVFFSQSLTSGTHYPFKIQSMSWFFVCRGFPFIVVMTRVGVDSFFRLTALIVCNSSTASTRINFVSLQRFSSWTSTDTMQLLVVVIKSISLAAFLIIASCSGRRSLIYVKLV